MLKVESEIPLKSQMYVVSRRTESQETFCINSGLIKYRRKIGSYLSRKLLKLQTKENHESQSLAFLSNGIGKKLNRSYKDDNIDVVQLHWVGYGTISIEEIGRLRMPIFWRLADQWAFLGAEHYVNEKREGLENFRFQTGYLKGNRPSDEKGIDINKWVWERKLKSWNRKMGIVCPSNWMQECVKKSYLMNGFPSRVIPTAIDLEKWSPGDKSRARRAMGIPSSAKVILLTAEGGLLKERKGGGLLIDSIKLMKKIEPQIYSELRVVITGNKFEANKLGLDEDKVISMGQVNDDDLLRSLYRAADVVVIPSLQDNLPGTGLEAQACGIPVVAFDVGGLSDVLEHGATGLLAKKNDYQDLCNCLCTLLSSSSITKKFSSAARRRAELLWNPRRVSNMYYEFYMEQSEALTSTRCPGGRW
jgi:glycosyltransferase involved in cell wall biosynthesis